jgi:hypothetical protein
VRLLEHLPDDIEVKRWLTVEDDEELELILLPAVSAPEPLPGPPSLHDDPPASPGLDPASPA